MGGAMLPIFHDDLIKHTQHDLVAVTPELEDDSILVCSVTPTLSGEPSGEGTTSSPPFFHRNLSFTSRIRQKFPWLTSPSAQASSHCTSTPPFFQHNLSITSRIRQKFPWLTSPSAQTASQFEEPTASARDARKITAQLERTTSKARRTLTGLRFISRTTDDKDTTELWRKVESRFKSLAKDGLLSREDFGECIGMIDSKEFAVGIFDALARRRRQKIERITKEELYDFWLQISDQRFDGRLQIFFDIADSNEDGRITREEVQELIKLSASANKLSKLKEQAEEYASLIMEELDPENLGYIELWQLEALLLERDKYMSYSRALSVASSVGWSQNLETIKPKKVGVARRINSKVLRCLILEKWQRAWVITLWVLAMAALFACKFNQYRKKAAFQVMGYCLTTAKGAAETLKLNMALILLPVCRNTLTRLRSTRARLFVPLDDNINFHKMIACAIVIGTLLHAGTHLAPLFRVHIRTVGDWTEDLKRVLTETCDSPTVIGRAKFDHLGRIYQKGVPRLLVDGPYGTPAQDYQNYDVLLLVGLGIGATPFVSILRDLLDNIRAAEEKEEEAENMEMSRSSSSWENGLNRNASPTLIATWATSGKKKSQRTTNAHFYWVTREAGSFEWFKGVMNEIAEMDNKMHNYLTSVYEEGDARSTLLTMVQALNHAKYGVDILSGTRVRTHFARPNWEQVFARLASKHPHARVGVFCCGTPFLAKELKKLSRELTQTSSTRSISNSSTYI